MSEECFARILVVDDDQSALQSLSEFLEKEGMKCSVRQVELKRWNS
jgi:DNA-binding response OmpR family regulator